MPNRLITITDALERLRAGNERFATGQTTRPYFTHEILKSHAQTPQRPLATVLACSDSRVPVEVLFDCGVGDLFVLRIAGAVCTRELAGTIELGIEALKTPLVLVMGHTGCAAVTEALSSRAPTPNMQPIIARLERGLRRARIDTGQANPAPPDAVSVAACVWGTIRDLYQTSEIIRSAAKQGLIAVHGAVYDLEAGRVNFLGSHPEEAALL
ncbi:MAG: carbonic anhydrase [bacterium]